MSILATITAMESAGLSAEDILKVVKNMEEERLAKGRARTAKCRNNNNKRDVTDVTDVTSVTKGSSPSPSSPTPPSSTTPPPKEKPPTGSKRKSRLPDGFPDREAKEKACRYWRDKGRGDLVGEVDMIADAFSGWHKGHGTLAASWEGTWTTWYSSEARKAPVRRLNGHTAPTQTGHVLSKSEELKRRLTRLRDDGMWLDDWDCKPFDRNGNRDPAFAKMNGGWAEVDAVFGKGFGVPDLLSAAGGGR